MQNRAVAFANNDIAYIFWRVEKKIPSCLGFSISRIAPDGNQGALPAHVGFDKGSPGNHVVKKTTESWPIGYKASYANDENLDIIRGNRSLSEAYATHILDVTNHFSWRYKLTAMHKSGRLRSARSDLDETDGWQDKYFGAGRSLSRDEFFFSP
jgi:hypothetical protein